MRFWGKSSAQLRGLPKEVQLAFVWAIDQLEQDPKGLPCDQGRGVQTEDMRGDLALRRIKVWRTRDDPGFRGIYFSEGNAVTFLRFRYRDPATYAGLHADLRKLLGTRRS